MGKCLLLAIALATACDSPRSKRVASSPLDNSFFIKKGQVGMDTVSFQNLPAEIAHCNFSIDGKTGFEKDHYSLKEYTACQSSRNELDIYIQLRIPFTDTQLCLIPSNEKGKKSTYIGGPQCISVEDSKTIHKVTLAKNRPGFDKFKLNGIMIMKNELHFYPYPFDEDLLNTEVYLRCSEHLAQRGDSSYCEAFKAVGEYDYHRF